MATFREYAMSVMQNQLPAATDMLEQLLGLPAAQAATATTFFQVQIKDPAFMPKAMGLHTAVESGSDDQIGDILVDCFGLDPAQRASSITAVRETYPKK